MDDVVTVFAWLIGLGVTVVVIAALCQLFAIRRLLEALLKQNTPDRASIAVPLTEVAAPIPAADIAAQALAPVSARRIWIGIVAAVLIMNVLVWLTIIRH